MPDYSNIYQFLQEPEGSEYIYGTPAYKRRQLAEAPKLVATPPQEDRPTDYIQALKDFFGVGEIQPRPGIGGEFQNAAENLISANKTRGHFVEGLSEPFNATQRGYGELTALIPGLEQELQLHRDSTTQQIEQGALGKLVGRAVTEQGLGLEPDSELGQFVDKSVGGVSDLATNPLTLAKLHPATAALFAPDMLEAGVTGLEGVQNKAFGLSHKGWGEVGAEGLLSALQLGMLGHSTSGISEHLPSFSEKSLKGVIPESVNDLPDFPDSGTITVYHGSEGASGSGGEFWTTDPKRAASYGKNVVSFEVPREVFMRGQEEARAQGQAGPMDTFLKPGETIGSKPVDVQPDITDLTGPEINKNELFDELGIKYTEPMAEKLPPLEEDIPLNFDAETNKPEPIKLGTQEEIAPKLEEDFPVQEHKLEEDFPQTLEEDFTQGKQGNQFDALLGKNPTQFSHEDLDLFKQLKDQDANNLVKNSSNPFQLAKLIIQSQQPSVRGSIRSALARQLLQQNGIQAPPPRKGGLPPVPKRGSYTNPIRSIDDYIGKIQSRDVKRDLVAQQFESLRSQGAQGLHDYEKNPSAFPNLQKFFADELARQKAAGVPIRELQNYLPHMFDGTLQQLQAYRNYLVQNRKQLGLRPGHTLPRQIASYEVAEQVFGLKPKFNNLADLAAQYHYQAEKAIADRGLYNHLKDNGLISTIQKPGFVEVPTGIPSVTLKGRNGQPITSRWFAEPATAKRLNNYFQDAGPVTQALARGFTGVRNLQLSGGVPGTGLNSLGMIMLNRYWKSDRPYTVAGIQRVLTGMKDLIYTPGAEAKFMDMLDRLPRAIEKGQLNMQGFGYHFNPDQRGFMQRLREAEPMKTGIKKLDDSKLIKFLGNIGGKVGEIIATGFDRPFLQKTMPFWKFTVYEKALNRLLKDGVPLEEAEPKAGEFANTIMSGENWEQKGRSRAWHTRARLFWLSPELLRSNLNMLGMNFKSAKELLPFTQGKTPEGKLYRRYMGAFVTLYALQQVIGKASAGKFSWDNPPGHLFDTYAGDKDSKHERYISPSYTSDDWIRLPAEVTYSLYRGDENKAFEMFMSRLQPLIASTFRNVNNRDWKGEKLRGEGIPAGRAILNTGVEFGKNFLPPSAISLIEAGLQLPGIKDFSDKNELGRNPSWEELLSNTFEGPEKIVKKRKHFDEPLGMFDFRKSNRVSNQSDRR